MACALCTPQAKSPVFPPRIPLDSPISSHHQPDKPRRRPTRALHYHITHLFSITRPSEPPGGCPSATPLGPPLPFHSSHRPSVFELAKRGCSVLHPLGSLWGLRGNKDSLDLSAFCCSGVSSKDGLAGQACRGLHMTVTFIQPSIRTPFLLSTSRDLTQEQASTAVRHGISSLVRCLRSAWPAILSFSKTYYIHGLALLTLGPVRDYPHRA